jgi:peroxiredoxin
MTRRSRVQFLLCLFLLQLVTAVNAAALQPASPAPRFELNDLQGRTVRIAAVPGNELLLLFFFDAESRSSVESLKTVNALARRHPSQLAVYGISASPPDVIKASLVTNNVSIPVLRATASVRELYRAGRILPVGCVIGRDFKVLSYYQGGGEGFTSAVVDAVERELKSQIPSPARLPAAKPAVVKKVEHAGRPQEDRRRVQASASSRPAAPGAGSQRSGSAASKEGDRHLRSQSPSAAVTPTEPPPLTPDRSSSQNSVGKILNDHEW